MEHSLIYSFLDVEGEVYCRRKNDPAKDRKALATYVELKGYKHGRPNKETIMDSFSLDEIAKELNMFKRNLQRALRIERNLTY